MNKDNNNKDMDYILQHVDKIDSLCMKILENANWDRHFKIMTGDIIKSLSAILQKIDTFDGIEWKEALFNYQKRKELS